MMTKLLVLLLGAVLGVSAVLFVFWALGTGIAPPRDDDPPSRARKSGGL